MGSRVNIVVAENAKDLIRQKGGAFYIDPGKTTVSCCLDVNFGPDVRLGTPPNKHQFRVEELDDIMFYIPATFVSPFPLTVVVSQFLWHRHLAVEGWKLV